MTRTDIFLAILFAHLAFRRLFDLSVVGWGIWPAIGAAAFGFGAAVFLLAAGKRWRTPAVVLGAVIAGADVVLSFPVTDNHAFVEFFCMMLAAVCCRLDFKSAGAEKELLEQSLKIVLALIFIHAGWQKVAHGAYFDGSFLLLMAGVHENFRPVVEWALGESGAGVLAGIGPEGPFVADSMGLRVLSNGIYLGELATGLLLLFPKTRKAGLTLLIIGLVAIESVAREVVFGLLCLNLALLHAPRDWARKSIPVFFAAYLFLLVSVAGLGWEIHFK